VRSYRRSLTLVRSIAGLPGPLAPEWAISASATVAGHSVGPLLLIPRNVSARHTALTMHTQAQRDAAGWLLLEKRCWARTRPALHATPSCAGPHGTARLGRTPSACNKPRSAPVPAHIIGALIDLAEPAHPAFVPAVPAALDRRAAAPASRGASADTGALAVRSCRHGCARATAARPPPRHLGRAQRGVI
jgi:hypothetical protein